MVLCMHITRLETSELLSQRRTHPEVKGKVLNRKLLREMSLRKTSLAYACLRLHKHHGDEACQENLFPIQTLGLACCFGE